ncbi:MAG TPA: hypothetical protein VHC22_26370 [Pirellulales bacterium]|nr:hypothetical protein [Pirellulales bacterium]
MRFATRIPSSGWFFCCALSLCIAVSGCSKRNAPAEPDLARSSLEAALGAWKSGETPDTLAQRSPSITMTDFAWRQEQKLTDFHLQGEPTNDGVNIHFQVELTLIDAQGATATEKVGYIVGTHPVITIGREVH